MAVCLGRGGRTMHTGKAAVLRRAVKLPAAGREERDRTVPGAERQREILRRVRVLPEQYADADRRLPGIRETGVQQGRDHVRRRRMYVHVGFIQQLVRKGRDKPDAGKGVPCISAGSVKPEEDAAYRDPLRKREHHRMREDGEAVNSERKQSVDALRDPEGTGR